MVYGRVQEARHQQEVEQHKKFITKKFISAVVVLTLSQFWWAQLVVWGLAMFHVSSGIWPVWLIMEGFSSLSVGAVHLGMMSAVRDTRH